MVETRWIRRVGPGIVTLGALAVVAATTLGASGRSWSPPPCAGPPSVPPLADRTGATAWYREDAVLVDGTLHGMRVTFGLADLAQPRSMDVDREAFAAGPFGDTVLVGSDDGRVSRLSLIDVRAGCAWPIASSRDVIRRATIGPDGRTVYEVRVDRTTRADLGVWRRSISGRGEPSRLLDPLPADARFGRTFTTAFTWSTDGSLLAVRSCGEVACRVRVLDTATRGLRLFADPDLGDIIGLTRTRLVVHGACRGLPCPVVSVPLRGGARIVLAHAAGLATMTTLVGGDVRVVMEAGPTGRDLRSVSPDGRADDDAGVVPDGRRLVPSGGRAGDGVAMPPGWIAFGVDGRLPLDGARHTRVRDLGTGRTAALDEVPR
jgi:hypothetical protein